LRTHHAILSSLCALLTLYSRPVPATDNDDPILTYFLLDQALAREFVDRCSQTTPSPLKEDFQVTFASYLLQLTQAQRILENRRIRSLALDQIPLQAQQKRAKDEAADFVEEAMRRNPTGACRYFFRTLRSEVDAVVIAQRRAESIERVDAKIRSFQRSPPQEVR
jgi:hypothetical protein